MLLTDGAQEIPNAGMRVSLLLVVNHAIQIDFGCQTFVVR
jgi:hypothetical protein